MDLTVSIKIGLPLRRMLPYWAVFRHDLGQTLRSGLFRACGLVVLALCAGLVIHRSAIYREAGNMDASYSSALVGEMLRFFVLVGSTIVIVLSANTISSEREVLADAVLCRGVSRWQYFLGKWHARTLAVVGGMVLVGLLVVSISMVLFRGEVHWKGTALAFGLVASMLTIVATAGVTLSALVNSSVLGIALLWIGVYGLGAALHFLQIGTFDLPRLLSKLPEVLVDQSDVFLQLRLIGGFVLGSICLAFLGGLLFSRRDL